MMRAFLAALLLMVALPAQADPIVVNGGEHADFSRLVFYIGGNRTWKLGRSDTGYHLRIENSDVGFQTEDVFFKIPRDRVADLKVRKDGVDLVVECDCHADGFEFKPGILVVDIKDGPPPRFSRFEGSLAGDELQKTKPGEGVTASESAQKNKTQPTSLQQAQTQEAAQDSSGSQDLVQVTLPLIHGSEPVHAQGTNTEQVDPRLKDLQEELLRQLGRAASQGLLEADTDVAELAENTEIPEEMPEEKPIETAGPPPGTSQDNFLAETQVDRDSQRDNPAPDSGRKIECVAASLVDVSGWGSKDHGVAAIQVARSALLAEFDEPNAEKVIALARAYLYAGFGAEARSTLTSFVVRSPDQDLLLDIAKIMDSERVPPGSRLFSQLSCPGPVALWAMLAGEMATDTDLARADVLAAFSALPIHLRKHLGPRLAERFLDIDDVNSSQAVRAAILRVEDAKGSELEMLDAKLSERAGETEEAAEKLEAVIARDDPASLEALTRLLLLSLKDKRPVDEAKLLQAEALLFEHRGTSFAATLRPLLIEASALAGDHEAAVDLLSEADDLVSDELWRKVLTSVVENASEANFLKIGFDPKVTRVLKTENDELLLKFADRFIAVGFQKSALALLNALTSPTDKARFLMAQAELMEGDATKTILHLTGLTGADADDLRQKALDRLAGAPPETASVESEAANGGENAATATVEAPESGETPVVTLSRGKTVVDESAALRSEIENLLASPSS